MSKEVMQQALDALNDMNSGWRYIRHSHGDLYGVGWDRAQEKADASIDALTAALALPDAQPVAWRPVLSTGCLMNFITGKPQQSDLDHWTGGQGCTIEYAYSTPQPVIAPEPVKLTTDDIWELWKSENGFDDCDLARCRDFEKVVRAVESAIHAKQAAK